MILKTRPPEPKDGDVKETKHYAWFPTWVNDQQIWLQGYARSYKYIVKDRQSTPIIGGYILPTVRGKWGEWELVGETIIYK